MCLPFVLKRSGVCFPIDLNKNINTAVFIHMKSVLLILLIAAPSILVGLAVGLLQLKCRPAVTIHKCSSLIRALIKTINKNLEYLRHTTTKADWLKYENMH